MNKSKYFLPDNIISENKKSNRTQNSLENIKNIYRELDYLIYNIPYKRSKILIIEYKLMYSLQKNINIINTISKLYNYKNIIVLINNSNKLFNKEKILYFLDQLYLESSIILYSVSNDYSNNNIGAQLSIHLSNNFESNKKNKQYCNRYNIYYFSIYDIKYMNITIYNSNTDKVIYITKI